MKHLKIYEKYTHTNQDELDDMTFIKEFSKKFEDLFELRLNLERYQGPELRSYLGYGANTYYDGSLILDNRNILKRKVEIKYSIYIETDINPNGIKNENDIGRTYSIKFELRKNVSRNVNNVKDFYGYSRDMDDILERFHNYLISTLGICHLTEEEKEERMLRKSANKFNL